MALGCLLVLLLQLAAAERDDGSSDAAAHLAQGSLQRVAISRKVAKHTTPRPASASQISGLHEAISVDTRTFPQERADALTAAVERTIRRFEAGWQEREEAELEARGMSVSDLGRSQSNLSRSQSNLSQSGLVPFGHDHDYGHSERIPGIVYSDRDGELQRQAEERLAREHSVSEGSNYSSSIGSGSQDVGMYPAIHEFIDIISQKVGDFRDHIEQLDQKAAEAEESSKTFGIAVNTMEGGMYNLQMKQIPKFREVVACNQSNKLRGAIPLLKQGKENGKKFSENIASGEFAEVSDLEDFEELSANGLIGDQVNAPAKVLPVVQNLRGLEVGFPIYIMNRDGQGEVNVMTNDRPFTLLWETVHDYPDGSKIIKLSEGDQRLEELSQQEKQMMQTFQRHLAESSDLQEGSNYSSVSASHPLDSHSASTPRSSSSLTPGSRVDQDREEAAVVLTKAVGDARRDLSSPRS